MQNVSDPYLFSQHRGVGGICERGVRVPMASAGARAYNGVWGRSPQRSEAPLKLIAFPRIYVWRSGQIGSILCVWEKTAKKQHHCSTTHAEFLWFIFVVPQRGVRTNPSNHPPPSLHPCSNLYRNRPVNHA